MLSFNVGPSSDGLLKLSEPHGAHIRSFFGARDLFGAIWLRASDHGTKQVVVSSAGLSTRQEHEFAALLHLLRESGFRVRRDV